MNKRIAVAVVGASGYSGQELLRLLVQHPAVELRAITSRSEAGKGLVEVLPRFAGLPGAELLKFEEPSVEALAARGVEVAFLALPHGVSLEYAPALLDAGIRVIDLSADYRLDNPHHYEEYYGKPHPQPGLLAESVYGLVEWRREAVRTARLVAAPGCYPTSILLPLLPLLAEGLIEPDTIVANSLSGASGAGRSASIPLLFCEVAESLRAYGLPKHRHLAEIEEQLGLAAGTEVRISFQPHLVPVRRGIVTTTNARAAGTLTGVEQVTEVYQRHYGAEPLVRLRGAGACPDSKDVVDSAFIDLGWHFDARTRRVILCSAEDNLSKGASAQAVQCLEAQAGIEAEGWLRRL